MNRLLALPILAALVLAGCTTPAQPPANDQPLDPTELPDAGDVAGNNTTVELKPPVARMEVFQGQLVYKANFVADNVTAPATVRGGEPVTFLGSDSEAVDKTARVDRWEWNFGDGGRASGRSATHSFRDTGGIFRVTLTVWDTLGSSDSQQVLLGVEPTRTFTEAVALSGGAEAGVLGTGAAGQDTFDHPLALADQVQGFPVEVEGLTLTLTPGEDTSDFDLYLLDAEGNVVGASAASGPVGLGEPALATPESLTFGPGELAPGAYTLRVVFYFGAQGTYDVAGEVLYRVVNPQVEAQFGGHAH